MRNLRFVAVAVASAVVIAAAVYLVNQIESQPATAGRSPRHPGILALVLASHCRSGELGAARQLIRQITSPIRNAALRRAVVHCEQDFRFADAETDLRRGKAGRAIRLMTPWYPRGPDPYRAGVILLHATLLEHHLNRAIAMGVSLEARYPHDASIAGLLRRLTTRARLDQARRALTTGHPHMAIALAGPVYRAGQDRYRAGEILAQAELAVHQLDAAKRIYASLVKRYPADLHLRKKAGQLRLGAGLAAARRALSAHEPARALVLAGPLYRSGQDPYGSGLVVARADLALGHPGRAAVVYAALARRYPRDSSLAVAAVVTHVQAGHPKRAQSELKGLNPATRAAVFNSLGSTLTRLYGHFVTVDGGVAESTGTYPADNQFGLRAGFPSSVGNFVVSAQRYHRFGETAEDLGLDFYTALGAGYAGELSLAYSPNNRFLADESFGAALSKSLGVISIDGSIRHLIFSGAVANVLFGGVGFYPVTGLHIETGLYYVPETRAYSILVAPEWFHGGLNRTYLYLTAGEAGEELVVQNSILRTPSYGVRLGEVFELSHRFSLNVALFLDHRSGLYDRRGIYLSLTRRW